MAVQGDPEAGTWFCVAWHPQVRTLDSVLAEAGGAAKLGMDDLFATGPADVVFPALERFFQEIEQTCLLQLERSKTEVFTWSGQLPAGTPEGFPRAGTMVGEEFCPGFLCYGIPIGTPAYVRHQLSLKVHVVMAISNNTYARRTPRYIEVQAVEVKEKVTHTADVAKQRSEAIYCSKQ